LPKFDPVVLKADNKELAYLTPEFIWEISASIGRVSLTDLLTYLPTYLLAYLLIYLYTYLFTYLLTYILTYLLLGAESFLRSQLVFS